MMYIGYPCVNYTIKRSTNNTFRLSSYSHDKVRETIQKNIDHFWDVLRFNIEHDIHFFRLGSQFIPFASHEIFDFSWQDEFRDQLQDLGEFIHKHQIFLTMHPGQYVVLNSPKEEVVQRSIKELDWHAELLDIMSVDGWIQIHIGGVFGDKESAIDRFIENYKRLPGRVKRRLALENDDKLYNFSDIKLISERLHTKIIFDVYHHKLNPSEHSVEEILSYLKFPVIDYSSGDNTGRHHDTIDLDDFLKFYELSKRYESKIMFEIKDKEKSVIRAINYIKRFKVVD